MLEMGPSLTHNLRNSIRALRSASEREECGLFVAEGEHAAQSLALANVTPSIVVVQRDAPDAVMELAERLESKGAERYLCSGTDMERMADATSPQSILCVVPFLPERPLRDRILVLDAVADPGNVGTMIRTAAWFGFSDVVLGMECADLYNPKVVRSTAGALLSVNIHRRKHLASWLHTLDERPTIAAVPRGGEPPATLHALSSFALIVGSEAHGVSSDVLQRCSHRISIPGTRTVESLNAAMAAAILCYEGRRP